MYPKKKSNLLDGPEVGSNSGDVSSQEGSQTFLQSARASVSGFFAKFSTEKLTAGKCCGRKGTELEGDDGTPTIDPNV